MIVFGVGTEIGYWCPDDESPERLELGDEKFLKKNIFSE